MPASRYIPRVSRSIRTTLLLSLMCGLFLSACSLPWGSQGSTSNKGTQQAGPKLASLPGQQIWKQNTSSYLFGTNDTIEWSQHNLQTEPVLQTALRTAGISLVRSFFFKQSPEGVPTSDAQIEARYNAIKNSGAQCLAVLPDAREEAFNKHVVSQLGSRCNLYEFGNEPDLNGLPLDTYLKLWNQDIPQMRKLNPHAMFMGPTTYNATGKNDYLVNFLKSVKSSQVLPNVVSFHWYPCYQMTEEKCLAQADSYATVAQTVQQEIKDILGKDVPVGITEWNYDPSNPPPEYGNKADFIRQFTTRALNAMAQAHVAIACQFDAASYSGYGRLDMLDVNNNQGKPQYFAMKDVIQRYRSPGTTTTQPQASSQSSGSSQGQLISRGRPVTCSHNTDGAGGENAIVSGKYAAWSFWRSNFNSLPDWCAIHLDGAAQKVLLTWYSDYVFDYISDTGLTPKDYSISVSGDSTNGADGHWQTLVNVTGNQARAREHLLQFGGQSWVKMTVTKGQAKAYSPMFAIDQIDVYDVSASTKDTFFFSGDSITGMAYDRSDKDSPAFVDLVHQANSRRFPVMMNGGLGGWNSEGATEHIDQWLAMNPDMHYWLLEWGTNDALGSVPVDQYQAHIQTLIDKVKAAGREPILAKLPYTHLKGDQGATVDRQLQSYNAVIDRLTASNNLMHGPDLYQSFKQNSTGYLLPDGIHPTPAGAIAINKAWFEALKPQIQ